MLYLIEQCLNGVQLGMLLFLLAAGLTLIFGIMDLVNLAHGSLYMLGAYFAATFAAVTDSFLAGIGLGLIATLVAGMVMEVIAIRPLYGRDHLDHVLGTFGLLIFFNELVRLIWGPAGLTLSLPAEMLTAVQVLPGIYYPLYRLVIILATLAVALLLYFLVMRTRIGMLIRAGASNREMVGALGINIKLLYTLVFGLGAALAGFAGMMQAPLAFVQIGMGENILILAFVVIIIGGIGSIRGAFVAAIIVGMIDTDRPGVPAGPRAPLRQLQRRLERRAGAFLDDDLCADGGRARVPAGRPVSGVGQMIGWLTPRNAFVAALLAILVLLPVYSAATGNTFVMTLFTRIVILAIAAVSLNLIMGFGGMVSFGHAAYLGIGGYAVGILAKEGVNAGLLQWPLALAMSALFALATGALSLRTRGVYFIMITLAFAQMIYYVAIGLDRYGGDDGMTIHKRSQFDFLAILLQALCARLVAAVRVARYRHRPRSGAGLPRRDQPLQQDIVLLSLPRAAVGDGVPGLADRELPLRHGHPGSALERPPHAHDRLPDLSLQARLLRDCRHDLRPLRRAPGQPYRFHQSGDHALDALRRPDRHGGARRNGHGVRTGHRCGRAAHPGRGAVPLHGILAAHHRSAIPPGRAVRARRHRRTAREYAPWLTRSCRSRA